MYEIKVCGDRFAVVSESIGEVVLELSNTKDISDLAKKSFETGYWEGGFRIFKTPLKITIPLVILSASIYLAIGFVTNLIAAVSVDAAIIAGITLVFPALVLIRVYITRVLIND